MERPGLTVTRLQTKGYTFLAKPDAEKWRSKPINHYNEMLDLFGKDRATRVAARTTKERRNQMNINEERIDTIDEIDQLLETKAVSLENFDTNESFQAIPHWQVNLPTTTKIKSRKRNAEEDVAFMSKIVSSPNNIVDATDKSSKVMENSRPHVYPKGEIYKELQLMGMNRADIVMAYRFFMERSLEDILRINTTKIEYLYAKEHNIQEIDKIQVLKCKCVLHLSVVRRTSPQVGSN
ncbi:hypothetical protein Tco_0543568 [Tanacetum coccineum]